LKAATGKPNTQPASAPHLFRELASGLLKNIGVASNFVQASENPKSENRLSAGENQREFSNRQPYSSSDSFKSH